MRRDPVRGDERGICETGQECLLNGRNAAVDQNAGSPGSRSAKKYVYQKGTVFIPDGEIPAVYGGCRYEILSGVGLKSRKILREIVFQRRFLRLGERHAVLYRTSLRQRTRFFDREENVIVRLKQRIGDLHNCRRADLCVGSGQSDGCCSSAGCGHCNGNELTVCFGVQFQVSEGRGKQRSFRNANAGLVHPGVIGIDSVRSGKQSQDLRFLLLGI